MTAVLHWELRAQNWMALASGMTTVESRLQDLVGSGAIQRSPVRWVSAGHPTSVPRIDNWSPRIKVYEDGRVRCAGTLTRSDPVWAAVFLFALSLALSGSASDIGEVTFADDAGNELAVKPSTMNLLQLFSERLAQEVLKAAGEVGLIPHDVRLSEVQCEVEDFWF